MERQSRGWMSDREPSRLVKEKPASPDHFFPVLSFARVEDLLEDAQAAPPENRVVRVNSLVREGEPDSYGIALRTGSIRITATRGREILVANFVVGRLQTIMGRPWRQEEAELLNQNLKAAKEVLEEQVKEAGFIVKPGAYLIPEGTLIYRSTSKRIGFDHGRLVRKDQPL